MSLDPAKYIVVEKQGVETVIIFPCWMLHADIAGGKKVISAGKVRFRITNSEEPTESQKAWDAKPLTIKAHCFGNSVGLKVKSRPEEDERLIEKTILSTEE